jgi:hypothetical protein
MQRNPEPRVQSVILFTDVGIPYFAVVRMVSWHTRPAAFALRPGAGEGTARARDLVLDPRWEGPRRLGPVRSDE